MHDPFSQFAEWFNAAVRCAEIREPTAMTLATAAPDGKPSARIVLLKGYGPEGFVFYSNFTSRKGREITANPHVALCFYWMPLDRQVRIEGSASPVSAAEADTYFASRERQKQCGAWASLQSQPLDAPFTLQQRCEQIEQQYTGRDIPRPPHWSGWRVTPTMIEFWQQGEFRLHQRDVYQRAPGKPWSHTLLYP